MFNKDTIIAMGIIILIFIPCVAFIVQTYRINEVQERLTACQSNITQQNEAIQDEALKFEGQVKQQKQLSRKIAEESIAYQSTTEQILKTPLPTACEAAIKYGIMAAQTMKQSP